MLRDTSVSFNIGTVVRLSLAKEPTTPDPARFPPDCMLSDSLPYVERMWIVMGGLRAGRCRYPPP